MSRHDRRLDIETSAASRTLTLPARLQRYAHYLAEEPAAADRLATPTTVTALDLHGGLARGIFDLRCGSVVRLCLSGIGWRHVEVRHMEAAGWSFRFLLPLLPHELRAARSLAQQPPSTRPPRRQRTSAWVHHCIAAVAHQTRLIARQLRPVGLTESRL